MSMIFTFGKNAIAISKNDTTFKIAIIFPFHYNEYSGANINRANIMLDYYQGFFSALKEYEKKDLNIKLYIYDNQHDTTVTKEILAKPEIKKMNLIISPILSEHLHILNHFSSKNQIPVLSPFTAADSLFPKNPLFFNAAPAEKTKAEAFFEYFRKNCPEKKIIIIKGIHHKNIAFEKRLEELILSKNDIEYRFVTSEEIESADSNFLPAYHDYIIYHSADNIKEIKNITALLDKQKAKFEILAEYKPAILKSIHYSKRNKYNIKIISADFINPSDSSEIMNNFKSFYKTQFSLNPSRYSVIGHDQASFIAEILLKYKRFRAVDFTNEQFQFFYTKYLFKKDPHCNQNKGVFILKYNENILEEVISN